MTNLSNNNSCANALSKVKRVSFAPWNYTILPPPPLNFTGAIIVKWRDSSEMYQGKIVTTRFVPKLGQCKKKMTARAVLEIYQRKLKNDVPVQTQKCGPKA